MSTSIWAPAQILGSWPLENHKVLWIFLDGLCCARFEQFEHKCFVMLWEQCEKRNEKWSWLCTLGGRSKTGDPVVPILAVAKIIRNKQSMTVHQTAAICAFAARYTALKPDPLLAVQHQHQETSKVITKSQCLALTSLSAASWVRRVTSTFWDSRLCKWPAISVISGALFGTSFCTPRSNSKCSKNGSLAEKCRKPPIARHLAETWNSGKSCRGTWRIFSSPPESKIKAAGRLWYLWFMCKNIKHRAWLWSFRNDDASCFSSECNPMGFTFSLAVWHYMSPQSIFSWLIKSGNQHPSPVFVQLTSKCMVQPVEERAEQFLSPESGNLDIWLNQC